MAAIEIGSPCDYFIQKKITITYLEQQVVTSNKGSSK